MMLYSPCYVGVGSHLTKFCKFFDSCKPNTLSKILSVCLPPHHPLLIETNNTKLFLKTLNHFYLIMSVSLWTNRLQRTEKEIKPMQYETKPTDTRIGEHNTVSLVALNV